MTGEESQPKYAVRVRTGCRQRARWWSPRETRSVRRRAFGQESTVVCVHLLIRKPLSTDWGLEIDRELWAGDDPRAGTHWDSAERNELS